jgi:hypothetical protein
MVPTWLITCFESKESSYTSTNSCDEHSAKLANVFSMSIHNGCLYTTFLRVYFPSLFYDESLTKIGTDYYKKIDPAMVATDNHSRVYLFVAFALFSDL